MKQKFSSGIESFVPCSKYEGVIHYYQDNGTVVYTFRDETERFSEHYNTAKEAKNALEKYKQWLNAE